MRGNGATIAAGVLAAAVGAAGAVHAATRLDRLHRRTDAAWRALDDALRRRAHVVQALRGDCAGAPPGIPPGGAEPGSVRPGSVGLRLGTDPALRVAAEVAVRAAADAALGAGPGWREEVENELSRVLAVLDRRILSAAEAARLADAEQRVVLARRVYNDAVRDTLALRSHRLVRWFKLAATAPLPRYFEIAEPSTAPGAGPGVSPPGPRSG